MDSKSHIAYSKLTRLDKGEKERNNYVVVFLILLVLSLVFYYAFYSNESEFGLQFQIVKTQAYFNNVTFLPNASVISHANSPSSTPSSTLFSSSPSSSPEVSSQKDTDYSISADIQTTETVRSSLKASSASLSTSSKAVITTSSFQSPQSSTSTKPDTTRSFESTQNKDFPTTPDAEDYTKELKYLVDSQSCHIPDSDPFDPSIIELVETFPPLVCNASFPKVTYSKANTLYIDDDIASKAFNGSKLQCCYKAVYRTDEGESDNNYKFDEQCRTFESGSVISDEFIRVECIINGSVVYTNYHPFIQPKLIKSNSSSDASKFSVLIIGADAVSRLNMHRQFNRTYRYLKDRMDAIEFFGYNKIGDNTFPNLIPLLTGFKPDELDKVCWADKSLPLDKCPFMWKRFKKEGYVTYYAEDTPWMSTFNYLKEGFYTTPTDFYFRPFMKAAVDELGHEKYMNAKLCVGPISQTEMSLGWLKNFVTHYHDQPYFSFSWINSITHDDVNYGSKGDAFYEEFFRDAHEKGLLNKTIVIFMSDHGIRWGRLRQTYIGKLEERLPMLMMHFPKLFVKQYPKLFRSVKKNARKLVTPFDLHATLCDIVNLSNHAALTDEAVPEDLRSNFTQRKISLFDTISPDRSCEEAFISDNWCTCHSSQPVPFDDPKIVKAATAIVMSINDFLADHRDKCAVLGLVKIKSARKTDPNFSSKESDDKEYSLIIQTEPDDALFEATVRFEEGTSSEKFAIPQVIGSASRLTLYRHLSECVDDPTLRKYCSCLDKTGLRR